MYWLSIVHPEGRPHVTPIAGVWLDDALCFSTGQEERKARNLALNTACVVTTGCNVLDGMDVVVEGEAVSSAENRAGTRVKGGDEVDVDIKLDTAPREVTVPPDFAA